MAYVYLHVREDKEEVFYVGIGSDDKHHRANTKRNRNRHWHNVVNKLNGKYETYIIMDGIEYDYAQEMEKYFIELYGRRDLKKGTLCNLTDGGQGCLGLKHSKEARRKMGLSNKGKSISDWHKERISEFHKGKKQSDEWKLMMSERMKGEKNHRYGKKASEETKIKMSESALKGEKNNSSKLTKSDVLKIRELSKEGMYLKDISQKFGVSKSNIFSVVNRKTWKHI